MDRRHTSHSGRAMSAPLCLCLQDRSLCLQLGASLDVVGIQGGTGALLALLVQKCCTGTKSCASAGCPSRRRYTPGHRFRTHFTGFTGTKVQILTQPNTHNDNLNDSKGVQKVQILTQQGGTGRVSGCGRGQWGWGGIGGGWGEAPIFSFAASPKWSMSFDCEATALRVFRSLVLALLVQQ